MASTKTFISSLAILHLLSVYLGQVRGHLDDGTCRRLVDELARGPGLIGEAIAMAEILPGPGQACRPLRQLPFPGARSERPHRL